jgi:hypothetical protein
MERFLKPQARRPKPSTRRQSEIVFQTNLQRCFDRVDALTGEMSAVKSMIESTNQLTLDLDKKVDEAMKLASLSYSARHSDVANAAGGALENKKTSTPPEPWTLVSREEKSVAKQLVVRFVAGPGEKMKVIESDKWETVDGIVVFYRESRSVFLVSQDRFISSEVID